MSKRSIKYLGLADAGRQAGKSKSRIHQMLKAGRIRGAYLAKLGGLSIWQIPDGFRIEKP